MAVAVANFSSLVLAERFWNSSGLFSSLRMVCRSEIALLSWPMPVNLAVVSLSRRLSCASFGAFSAATRVETMFLISRPEL